MKKSIYFLTTCSILLFSGHVWGQSTQKSPTSDTTSAESTPTTYASEDKSGYVINFSNVSIIEYLRFISHITNTNFVFQDSDLQFNVTILSEGPTSVTDIMSALLQILRIHGLSLVEQGNNILVYKNSDVTKIASVVTDQGLSSAPIETRVIKLNFASPEKIKAIILPLLSSQAIVEISGETKHLIVTDISTNVDKVMQLVTSLDINNNQVEVLTYFPQNGSADSLIFTAEKILVPIASLEGSFINLVKQSSTNTIFIVGTASITQRALHILEALDQPGTALDMPQTSAEVKTYAALNMPASSLVTLAEQILQPIAISENIPFNLVIQPSTQIIYITSTPAFNTRTLDLFKMLDKPGANPQEIIADLPKGDIDRSNFYLYKLQNQNGERIQAALRQVSMNLRTSQSTNEDLINALNDLTWFPDTNSLLFLGTNTSVLKIRKILEQIDVPSRQVYIEVLILRTSLENSLNFGVQWAGSVQNCKGFNLNTGSIGTSNPLSQGTGNTFPLPFQIPPTAATAASPVLPLSQGFNLGSIGDYLIHNGKWFGSIGGLVNAIQGENDTKIILNPKILAEDNRQAQVFIGQNTPFTTTNVNITAANSSTGFTVDYRDVGVLLQVTPTLGLGDMVTLELHQEINEIDPLQSVNIDGYPLPTTQKILTTTRVHVPSGYFMVISGLIKNTKAHARVGIPCLGFLPVIGGAFSDQAQDYKKENVIIFLQPRIIDTPCQMGWMTKHEGKDFYCNSMPEPANPDCQTNSFYHDYSPGPNKAQCR